MLLMQCSAIIFAAKLTQLTKGKKTATAVVSGFHRSTRMSRMMYTVHFNGIRAIVNNTYVVNQDEYISYSYITVYCGIHERIASVFHCRQ